jgi:hypothetical protein
VPRLNAGTATCIQKRFAIINGEIDRERRLSDRAANRPFHFLSQPIRANS